MRRLGVRRVGRQHKQMPAGPTSRSGGIRRTSEWVRVALLISATDRDGIRRDAARGNIGKVLSAAAVPPCFDAPFARLPCSSRVPCPACRRTPDPLPILRRDERFVHPLGRGGELPCVTASPRELRHRLSKGVAFRYPLGRDLPQPYWLAYFITDDLRLTRDYPRFGGGCRLLGGNPMTSANAR